MGPCWDNLLWETSKGRVSRPRLEAGRLDIYVARDPSEPDDGSASLQHRSVSSEHIGNRVPRSEQAHLERNDELSRHCGGGRLEDRYGCGWVVGDMEDGKIRVNRRDIPSLRMAGLFVF